MPRLRHDRPGLTYACPACDRGGQLYERTGNGNATDHPDRPFKCEHCGAAVRYAIERSKKGQSLGQQQTLDDAQGPKRMVDKLRAYNPEDVGLNPVGVRGGAAD